ncbi:putative ankyrin repeat protein RF_0381 [Candidatus Rickettsiella viridis]|uniref:Putative ankyrin repeat protein RF_0381 n=2 Tax=Candidatus Rickettsiella viridis TaxID=676208 RepID=A0A2Z5UV58_9COXI|nr:putative ankyrin repeat protein RF_0381 [Candidatus Rickettsiella viridis]
MKVEDIKTANFAKDNIPVIHLLLSNGAKVNARNNVGETPLDSALKFNWDNPNKKNALFEIKDVLGPRMLLQDPYTEKPKFLLEALGKEASERWDKQSKQLKYLIEKKSLGTEKQTLKSLNKFYCEKDSLGGQVLNDILKFKLSIEKNDHSQSESLSSTKSVPSLVSR